MEQLHLIQPNSSEEIKFGPELSRNSINKYIKETDETFTDSPKKSPSSSCQVIQRGTKSTLMILPHPFIINPHKHLPDHKGKKRWKLLKNVIVAVRLFQMIQVYTIGSPVLLENNRYQDEIEQDMDTYAQSPRAKILKLNEIRKKTSPLQIARKKLKIYLYTARGTQEDLLKLRKLLQNGPMKYALIF